MSHPGFLQELSVSRIHHPINQLRMDLDNLQELAISIKQHGLLPHCSQTKTTRI